MNDGVLFKINKKFKNIRTKCIDLNTFEQWSAAVTLTSYLSFIAKYQSLFKERTEKFQIKLDDYSLFSIFKKLFAISKRVLIRTDRFYFKLYAFL